MRFIAIITAMLPFLGFTFIAWGQPQGKWANLDRYPSCEIAFTFQSKNTVLLPDIRNPEKQIIASWRMQNNTIIITDKNKKWESYYSYHEDRIIWKSIKTLGQTQNIVNQYSLKDRTLKPCP